MTTFYYNTDNPRKEIVATSEDLSGIEIKRGRKLLATTSEDTLLDVESSAFDGITNESRCTSEYKLLRLFDDEIGLVDTYKGMSIDDFTEFIADEYFEEVISGYTLGNVKAVKHDIRDFFASLFENKSVYDFKVEISAIEKCYSDDYDLEMVFTISDKKDLMYESIDIEALANLEDNTLTLNQVDKNLL